MLEGFLLRLAHSPDRNQLVLKGGVLPAELDDGLTFDLSAARAEAIREEEVSGGVRVRLRASLATAREPFHVDVNVGDPIWPAPTEISLPRLLDQEPIRLMGYPMEMILAEKIVTAIQRGQANTRWRDFGDIYLLSGRHAFRAGQVRQALHAVANHRNLELMSISGALTGYAEISQPKWAAWRSKLQLTTTLPTEFAEVLESLRICRTDPHRLRRGPGNLGPRPGQVEPRGHVIVWLMPVD